MLPPPRPRALALSPSRSPPAGADCPWSARPDPWHCPSRATRRDGGQHASPACCVVGRCRVAVSCHAVCTPCPCFKTSWCRKLTLPSPPPPPHPCLPPRRRFFPNGSLAVQGTLMYDQTVRAPAQPAGPQPADHGLAWRAASPHRGRACRAASPDRGLAWHAATPPTQHLHGPARLLINLAALAPGAQVKHSGVPGACSWRTSKSTQGSLALSPGAQVKHSGVPVYACLQKDSLMGTTAVLGGTGDYQARPGP